MNIKRIMLIRPGLRFPEKKFAPPLGLLYLVSVLRQKFPDRFKIELIDQPTYNLNFEQIRKLVRNFNPDLVGFSCLSIEDNEMSKISSIVKELNPKCITVLGGPHASAFYDNILENSKIDIVVIGEGEVTFFELIQKIQRNESIDNIKGIAFKKAGKLIITEPREPIENLDSIPFPAWDMINFKKYSKNSPANFTAASPSTMIFTSRACPYRCAYCHNIFGKRTRFRSPENVISEIKLLTQKYGIKEIAIIDDIFNIDPARAKEICDLIIKEKIKIRISFPNGLRGDIMDKELIKKLKQAGCYAISYGVETASPRLQKLIQKNLDLEKIQRIIKWTHQEKIIPVAFFMLGFPGETKEEIEKTIQFALNSDVLLVYFSEVVLFPRTTLMEIAKKNYPEFNFSRWPKEPFNLRTTAETPFYTEVTGENLSKLYKNAYQRFYLRPKIIFQLLWRLPKNLSLIRGVFLGLLAVSNSFYKFFYFFSPHRKFINQRRQEQIILDNKSKCLIKWNN